MEIENPELCSRRYLKQLVWAYSDKRCYLCQTPLVWNKKQKKGRGKLPKNAFTIDHVVPLAEGGTNDFENLKACCFQCNNKKASLSKEDFEEIQKRL